MIWLLHLWRYLKDYDMYQRQLSEQKRSEKPSNLKRTRLVNTNTAQWQLPMAINCILEKHQDVFASQTNREKDQHEASLSWQTKCDVWPGWRKWDHLLPTKWDKASTSHHHSSNLQTMWHPHCSANAAFSHKIILHLLHADCSIFILIWSRISKCIANVAKNQIG